MVMVVPLSGNQLKNSTKKEQHATSTSMGISMGIMLMQNSSSFESLYFSRNIFPYNSVHYLMDFLFEKTIWAIHWKSCNICQNYSRKINQNMPSSIAPKVTGIKVFYYICQT